LLVFIETVTGIGLRCTACALTALLSMAQPAHVDWQGGQKRTTSTVLSQLPRLAYVQRLSACWRAELGVVHCAPRWLDAGKQQRSAHVGIHGSVGT
ncbi:MAG TPA: hypothetical protein VHV99_03660, partial [Paraburkholderia sp.]|nr:hypothetical protein [Paraburkholderia sp.]